jgi:hypothetical protein
MSKYYLKLKVAMEGFFPEKHCTKLLSISIHVVSIKCVRCTSDTWPDADPVC